VAGRGKGIGSKTFWTVQGVVDAKGQPVRFTTVEDAKATADERAGRFGSAPPVQQWQEDTYENGDKVASRYNPQSKDWEEVGVERDDKLADNYRADNPPAKSPDEARKAKADADLAEENVRKATQKPTPTVVPTAANEPFIVLSDGTKKENPNYTPPDTITRTAPTLGTNAGVDDPRSMTTETVSKAQGEFDQAQQRLTLDEARRQDQLEQQRLMTEIAQRRLTSDQALQQLSALREGLALKLQEAGLGLTARGQDISVRNADLDAGVSQRGQTMSFGASQARGAEGLAGAMLPYLAPAGSNARMDHLIRTGSAEGAPTVQPMGMPFDPRTFGNGVAQNAMQMAPPMILGAPVAPAQLPSVVGQYQAGLNQYQQQVPPRMVLGG
jgi:hypothetical protein